MFFVSMPLIFLISIIGVSSSYEFWDPADENAYLNTYFSNEDITTGFQILRDQRPDLVALHSLGESGNGHRINEITITHNVSNWEGANKPHVKYVGNMHGNEVRGRGLLMKLAFYLVTMADDVDVDYMLKNTVFHLIPTLNPDGFEIATKSCSGTVGRYTTEKTDLNRDFPNPWVTLNKEMGRESKLIAEYAESVPAVISISFHDGSLVVNYPWDGMKGVQTMVYAASPDDKLFIHLAKSYSLNHKTMTSKQSPCGMSYFEDGITNGNKWYQVFNGMQDWNYYYNDCFELTVELGCCKYPNDANATFTDVWYDNFDSLFALTSQAHNGISGKVCDHTGTPILGAVISVSGGGKPITVRHQHGYYWRPLLTGSYNVTATKPGYAPVTRRNIRVRESGATEVSFILIPKSQSQQNGNVTNGGLRSSDSLPCAFAIILFLQIAVNLK